MRGPKNLGHKLVLPIGELAIKTDPLIRLGVLVKLGQDLRLHQLPEFHDGVLDQRVHHHRVPLPAELLARAGADGLCLSLLCRCFA